MADSDKPPASPGGPARLATAARQPVRPPAIGIPVATPRPPSTSAPATATRSAPGRAAERPETQFVRDLGAAGRAAVAQAAFGSRPYLKMAFVNPYNLSLLTGGLAASVLTLNPFLMLATLGLEAIWLLHAPDSKRLQHVLWDPRFEQLRRSIEASARAQRMQGLPDNARARVEALVARREEIQRLAASNPSFAGDLLRSELVKTDKLVDAFLDMALTCERYEHYLDSVDGAQLERDRQRYAKAAQAEGAQGDIAKKNLDIVGKRIDKMEEIRKYLSVAKGQLDLIENSFQLIADQIVTMQSPQQLSGQLDELLDGVEAIRDASRDTEQLLGTIEREM